LLKSANIQYSHVMVVIAGEVLNAFEGRDVTTSDVTTSDVTAFTESSVHNYTCCIVQSIRLID